MSKLSHRDRILHAALDAIYAELPTVQCQGRCAGACGPILLTDAEARRLQLTAHRKPKTLPMAATSQDGAAAERCIYLTPADRCAAYAVRPLICRVWGVISSLSCPFGCVPTEWLDDLRFLRIAQRVEAIAGGRVLKTSPAGLITTPGETYASIPVTRTPEQIRRNSERVRGLRALHGGRILAVDEND